jgi:hypothetical protein
LRRHGGSTTDDLPAGVGNGNRAVLRTLAVSAADVAAKRARAVGEHLISCDSCDSWGLLAVVDAALMAFR